jgi:signal transduction histidine kinase
VNQVEDWSSDEAVSDILRQLSNQNNSNWVALRLIADGKVLSRSGSVIPYFQEISGQLEENMCQITQFSDENQKQYLQISGYVQVGKEQMELDMACDVTSIYETRKVQQDIYRRIYIIMLAVCLLIVYAIAFVLTRPLSGLSKAARRIADGNLSYRSMIHTNDEIGILSEDFNSMAEQVENSVENMRDTMEQQERFMGSFAHELKTPMTSIIGYADLIRRQTLTQEEEAEAANYIFTEGKRLERLSLKMLDIFSVEQSDVTFSSISLKRLLDDVIEPLRPIYAKENIEICCVCETGLCMLEPDLVHSLLLNLLDNSRKALNQQGKISIYGAIQKDRCQIIIEDNGHGIPLDAMEHLTEAFYRVDKARSRELGGAGLGLTLCAKIVELHNGTMRFEANGEQGLRVIVELKGGNAK